MNSSEIKKLMSDALKNDSEAAGFAGKLEQEGVSYDFSPGFTGRVLDRIFTSEVRVVRPLEFTRYLNMAFSRIALTGVAAIALLLLSIFLMEGDLSFNSILGIGDTDTESIVYLLTGN
jgi:hypothetical protein